MSLSGISYTNLSLCINSATIFCCKCFYSPHLISLFELGLELKLLDWGSLKWEVAVISIVTRRTYPSIRWLWTLGLAPAFRRQEVAISVQWLFCRRLRILVPFLTARHSWCLNTAPKELPEMSVLLFSCEETGFKRSNCSPLFYFKIELFGALWPPRGVG